MQELLLRYRQKINKTNLELSKLKTVNAALVASKLLVATALLVSGYKWIATHETVFLAVALVCAAAFAWLQKVDARFLSRLKLLKNLVRILETEIGALQGHHAAFPCGDEFLTSDHPYALDLDLFVGGGLFAALNRTVTAEGKRELAHWLQKTDVEQLTVHQRQEAVEMLKQLFDWRMTFAAIGAKGQLTMAPLADHFQQAKTIVFKAWHKPLFLLLGTVALIALAGNIFGVWGHTGWLSLFFLNLFVVSLWLRKTNAVYRQLTGSHKVAENYHDLLVHLNQLNESGGSGLVGELVGELTSKPHSSLQAFGKLRKLLASFDRRGNVLVTVALNGFFLHDVFLLMRYNRWVDVYANCIEGYMQSMAKMDALMSLANFAYNHPNFTKPLVADNTLIRAEQLGHPLISEQERVSNDFSIEREKFFYITTGANMAGKSTFLRTVGINMVLAVCGAPVCAKSFAFGPVALFTSMRTADNLEKHVSYFQAELLRLKALLALAKTEKPVLVILDEILKGTNSADKLQGSQVFLLKMVEYRVSGIIATHDLALGNLEDEMPENFQNICFEVYIHDDKLCFDYKLQKGVARNMNATWLLNRMLQEA